MYSSQGSFKETSLKYLMDDLNSLYEVIVKANKQVFLDYGVNMTDNLTIFGLAIKILLINFYGKLLIFLFLILVICLILLITNLFLILYQVCTLLVKRKF